MSSHTMLHARWHSACSHDCLYYGALAAVGYALATATCGTSLSVARTGFEEPWSSGAIGPTDDAIQYQRCSRGEGEIGFRTIYTAPAPSPRIHVVPWNSSQYTLSCEYTDLPEGGEKNWGEADGWCRAHGAQLVVIQDDDKLREVQQCVPPPPGLASALTGRFHVCVLLKRADVGSLVSRCLMTVRPAFHRLICL